MAGRFPREVEEGVQKNLLRCLVGPLFFFFFTSFFTGHGEVAVVVWFSKESSLLGRHFSPANEWWVDIVVGKRNKGVVSVPNSLQKTFPPIFTPRRRGNGVRLTFLKA